MYTIDIGNNPNLVRRRRNFEKTMDVDSIALRFMPLTSELVLLTNEYLFGYRGWINPGAAGLINFKTDAAGLYFY